MFVPAAALPHPSWKASDLSRRRMPDASGSAATPVLESQRTEAAAAEDHGHRKRRLTLLILVGLTGPLFLTRY